MTVVPDHWLRGVRDKDGATRATGDADIVDGVDAHLRRGLFDLPVKQRRLGFLEHDGELVDPLGSAVTLNDNRGLRGILPRRPENADWSRGPFAQCGKGSPDPVDRPFLPARRQDDRPWRS